MKKKEVLRLLKQAEMNLRAAMQEGKSGCTVGDEHKRAMRHYLTTWVAHPLSKAIEEIEEGK